MSITSWHASLYVPGGVGIVVSIVLLLFLRESPLHSAAETNVDQPTDRPDKSKTATPDSDDARSDKEALSKLLFAEVFTNPSI